ncbi:hypothetical protein BDB01DRAFT_46309 [Pilobolus umbonatus]|nr:hypothetical protein BDB01DRAFT_46309 [Pilobolus umbonatus]
MLNQPDIIITKDGRTTLSDKITPAIKRKMSSTNVTEDRVKSATKKSTSYVNKSHSVLRANQSVCENSSRLYSSQKRPLLSRTITPIPRPTHFIKRFSDSGGVLTSPSRHSTITKNLTIGQRVIIPSLVITGTIRYQGEIKFKKEGVWVGIELDDTGQGKNDGCIQGIRYFSCPPQTGLFVLASKVVALDEGKPSKTVSPVGSKMGVKSELDSSRGMTSTSQSDIHSMKPPLIINRSVKTANSQKPRASSIIVPEVKSSSLLSSGKGSQHTFSSTTNSSNRSSTKTYSRPKEGYTLARVSPKKTSTSIKTHELELERVNGLLEQSREEQRLLLEKINRKEDAWERLVSIKESYAIRVKEKEEEIARIKQDQEINKNTEDEMRAVTKENETLKYRLSQSETVEKQQARVIERLETHVRTLQEDQSNKSTMYEVILRENTASILKLKEQLSERDKTLSVTEREMAEMRKTNIDVIRDYEISMMEMKKKYEDRLMIKDETLCQLKLTIDTLQACPPVDTMVEEEEIGSRAKLETQLELTSQQLDREHQMISALSFENKRLQKEIQRLHAISITSDSEYHYLQKILENEIREKRQIMEELNTSIEIQGEGNMDVHLNGHQLQIEIEGSIRKMETTNSGEKDQYIKRIKDRNEQLENENLALRVSQQEIEQECIRLMDELLSYEKVEMGSVLPEDEKYRKLLQREIEQLKAHMKRGNKKNAQLENRQIHIDNMTRELFALESLVEHKVFDEAQLEDALNNEKRRVVLLETRLRDLEEESKLRGQSQLSLPISPTSPTNHPQFMDDERREPSNISDIYCEICECHGHEIMSCAAFITDPTKELSIYCINCDMFDIHTTEECPNHDETF